MNNVASLELSVANLTRLRSALEQERDNEKNHNNKLQEIIKTLMDNVNQLEDTNDTQTQIIAELEQALELAKGSVKRPRGRSRKSSTSATPNAKPDIRPTEAC